ncbi:MAG: DUF5677 domain-containing protein [Planctomycetota bacterium]
MPVYKWQERPTKHFGTVLVPFAKAELQRCDGKFQPIALQIDSGAVISTLRRSSAILLGLALEAGRPVALKSVGGGVSHAFVHNITTRFDPSLTLSVPFAIMTSEAVPNLLGRVGVFELLQVHFDATFQETQLLHPWLDHKDRRIWEFVVQTEEHILRRWPEVSLSGTAASDPELQRNAKNVSRRFLERAAQVLASIRSLLKDSTPYGAPALIRTLFELAWQFEYIMRDPEPRAKEYAEFYWITRYKQSNALAEHPDGFVSKRLAESPKRPEGEKLNRTEFERVRPMFTVSTKHGKERIAASWYKMSTRELAAELEREGEYRLIYASGSAWAHGDPFGTEPRQPHPLADPNIILHLALTSYERMLFLAAEAGRILLTNEQYEVLKLAMRQNA